ncbi:MULTISPECIES: hypothetical protein [Comamonas]|uniref:Uncharacterized protein n=1 Tax=Comamonas testosteroni TaxID=285 RepID=A0A8B4S1X4_COMTE|nr:MULTISPECIES: hypothetical protein [Comamonas]EHN65081.1 hypothetical protein CTATCC11996_14808 [Comamonas testosteroni ATCC 11996]QQN69509.1 hypothetical protein IYN88_22975 [Comamonas testosteroni]RDI11009.1 hypothetical protein DFO48_105525 [Comamonas sp. AG1104]SUY77084.1 Uncharacterised protein [Comamonas testosteroni]
MKNNCAALLPVIFYFCAAPALGQQTWQADLSSYVGPVARVGLPSEGATSRLVLIAFEYATQCNPLFTYVELQGPKFGVAEKQSSLPPSSIGGAINDKRYSGNSAAMTLYSNGIEVGFAMPDEMAMTLASDPITSISFTTPTGKEIPLPTAGLSNAAAKALDACTKKVFF